MIVTIREIQPHELPTSLCIGVTLDVERHLPTTFS